MDSRDGLKETSSYCSLKVKSLPCSFTKKNHSNQPEMRHNVPALFVFVTSNVNLAVRLHFCPAGSVPFLCVLLLVEYIVPHFVFELYLICCYQHYCLILFVQQSGNIVQ